MSLRPGDVEAALAREIELWEAFRARDRVAIERLVDPLALDVGPSGVKTRAQILGALDHLALADYAIDALQSVDSKRVSIASYRACVEGSYRGVPFRHREIYATSTWLHADGAMRLVHRTESPVD